jgi:hypothetical protein
MRRPDMTRAQKDEKLASIADCKELFQENYKGFLVKITRHGNSKRPWLGIVDGGGRFRRPARRPAHSAARPWP